LVISTAKTGPYDAISAMCRKNNIVCSENNNIFNGFYSSTMEKIQFKTQEKGKQNSLYTLGTRCQVLITASGPTGIGIGTLSSTLSVFVPNTKIGETAQIEILRIEKKGNKIKYAIARKIKTVNLNLVKIPNLFSQKAIPRLPAGLISPILSVRITKKGPFGTGLAESTFQNKIYKLIIPNAIVGLDYNVTVTRIRKNYSFAKIVSEASQLKKSSSALQGVNSLKVGSTLTITVPAGKDPSRKSQIKPKRYGKYIAVNLKGDSQVNLKSSILLVRLSLGAKLGQKVRIQIMNTTIIAGSQKSGENPSSDTILYLAKVIQISPISHFQLKQRTKQKIRQMIQNGLHFGEKTRKGQTNMKKYLWLTRNVPASKSSAFSPTSRVLQVPMLTANSEGRATLRGQRLNQNANQKRPMVKNGRYFVNLLKTRQCLKQVFKVITKYAAKGRTFLFVGTSKIYSTLIARAALFSKNFFVNTRWLGGMLTNWKTIVKSISKIRPILQQKQEIMTKILQKRQRIKSYFLNKLEKLNAKTKVLVQLGRSLLLKLKNDANNRLRPYPVSNVSANWGSLSLLDRSAILMTKRAQLFEKAQILFKKRQQLLQKMELLEKTNQQLYTNAALLQSKYQQYITQYTAKQTKLQELKALLVISLQLNKVAKTQGEKTYVGPYAKLTKYIGLNQAGSSLSTSMSVIPSPSKELFNKMISIMQAQTEQNIALGAGSSSIILSKRSEIGESVDPVIRNQENNQFIIFSKFLLKFSQSSNYLQKAIIALHKDLQSLAQLITDTFTLLQEQKAFFRNRLIIKENINNALAQIRAELSFEQKIVSIVMHKFLRLDAQRRLLSFIPRIKALAIRSKAVRSGNLFEATAAKQKIQRTVQLILRRLVDPKLKYSIDKIYDQKLRSKSKKTASASKKKWQSFIKYFGGISNMSKLTQKQMTNTIAIILGQQENINAVRECKKLGIKMINIVDTNSNSSLADHIIPANDDSRTSTKYILTQLLIYIRLAQKLRYRYQLIQTNTTKAKKFYKLASFSGQKASYTKGSRKDSSRRVTRGKYDKQSN
jgi:small subunit ribosomal protein S2